ncbi:NF041680 family putative transposase [Embleya sp. NPDC050154]|uniref:NF041680 family putative transposase n=1 Tax=Embleya sp. NPDC050154 TaxID=3363988 RepID=UPI0037B8E3D8
MVTSLPYRRGRVEAFSELSDFRGEFHACLIRRGDALFELADAVLCADGPVKTLVGLSLAPEHRRGHGALYDAVNHGRIDADRLRDALARLPLPRAADGRIVLAVDVSPWLRPDADTGPDRTFCHTFGRGEGRHQMVPGWPYSIVAALEPGRSSWTVVLDALRLGPGEDVAASTAVQVRAVVERLVAAGQYEPQDPDILVVLDAGYDVPRVAFLLAGLPVEVLGRMRSDRVMRRATPLRVHDPQGGRPPKHGGEFVFGQPETWGEPQATTTTETTRYGTAVATAWDRLHPRLTRRSAWEGFDGELPMISGTVVRLRVDHLPSGGDPKPVWSWWSKTDATEADIDHCWQSFLRRFDIEHTFRLLKQTLGWTKPRLRDPGAADRWTWIVIAAYAQLFLARPLAADLRRPLEKPAAPGRLTPARVRRGFRNLHPTCSVPSVRPNLPGRGREGQRARRTARALPVSMWDASSKPVRRTPDRATTRRAPNRGAQGGELPRLPTCQLCVVSGPW